MSDLISRDAAIDALKDVSEHYTDKGREWHPHVDFMVEAIQDLPSAQPEIIMCKDCIHSPAAHDDCPLPVQYVVPEGFCHLGRGKDE